ncbi:hypothetical protein PFICI_11476 [Pestalotiopsis fici W106-1]|uniref:Uncharacterized protein n=1 Tax=Pestalotiopsis fici (strain W106-1 / CGMCC3.15140) TaxID=1229662 RepID=W3WQK6_PESFW|nr:uncharacterized protein PFICI_11476 [Pestalotiopsis fici W106-1]ETS76089.1 hypothetical protein PFICI_11476 [Pestalotiopsis fici W106-1]
MAEIDNDRASLVIDLQHSDTGMTALQRTAESGQDSCIRLLLENGEDFTLLDNSGRTALFIAQQEWSRGAIQHSASHILELVIERDLESAICDDDLKATCAMHDNVDLLERLKQHGADFGGRDSHGWTSLELARAFQQTEVVRFLERQDA